jgi:hypothetical protein
MAATIAAIRGQGWRRNSIQTTIATDMLPAITSMCRSAAPSGTVQNSSSTGGRTSIPTAIASSISRKCHTRRCVGTALAAVVLPLIVASVQGTALPTDERDRLH